MQIFRAESGKLNFKLNGTAVALGRFDAMHRGHMSIIGRAVKYAKENGLKSLVYMFENEPAEVISGREVPSINTIEKRLKILEDAGVDIAVVQTFDKEVMNMPREEFVYGYLKEAFGARFAAVGFNYSFGRFAEGDAEYLKAEGERVGIEVFVEEGISDTDGVISSTRIRGLIADTKVDSAAELMGRYFSIEGRVVKGKHIGSDKLGFPTANINIPKGRVVPGLGVYVTVANIDGRIYPAITNVGAKPTFDDDEKLIETHICAELGDLYEKRINIEFCQYIRGIMRFASFTELANQLKKDREKSENYFKNNYTGGIKE